VLKLQHSIERIHTMSGCVERAIIDRVARIFTFVPVAGEAFRTKVAFSRPMRKQISNFYFFLCMEHRVLRPPAQQNGRQNRTRSARESGHPLAHVAAPFAQAMNIAANFNGSCVRPPTLSSPPLGRPAQIFSNPRALWAATSYIHLKEALLG
jgi:hypothetical protein